MERFEISSQNPNDNVGGGGCLCSESKVEGCDPPYAVFYVTDMEATLSPNVVICEKCVKAAAQQMLGDPLSAGEPNDQLVFAKMIEEEDLPDHLQKQAREEAHRHALSAAETKIEDAEVVEEEVIPEI